MSQNPFQPAPKKPVSQESLVKPTASSVASKALWEIMTHPIAYAPFAGIVGVNVFFPLPWWVNAPATLTAAALEFAWWKRNWKFLFEKHEAALEIKYRKAFNALGRSMVPDTNRVTRDALEAIIEVKAEIEGKIFEDNRLNAKERELLELLEETTIQAFETARNAATDTVPPEIAEALETLRELSRNFGTVLRPLTPTESEKAAQTRETLAQTTQTLRHRMEESAQVRRIVEETTREDAHN